MANKDNIGTQMNAYYRDFKKMDSRGKWHRVLDSLFAPICEKAHPHKFKEGTENAEQR